MRPHIRDVADVARDLEVARHLFRSWLADSRWTPEDVNPPGAISYRMVRDASDMVTAALHAVRKVIDYAEPQP